MPYSKKNVLFIDTGGLSCVHAERMSRDCANVYYWNYYLKDFPVIEDFAKGYGLGNVERVTRVFPYIKKADLIVFPGIGWGDWADSLREEGRTVFGAGEKGEDLELDRFKAKMIQDKLGLPLSYSEKITGLTKLDKYLDENKDVFVKPGFRGTRETTHVNSKVRQKSLMKKLNARYGPMRDEKCAVFVCEDPIKNAIAEAGFDIVCNGKEAIKPYSFGLEKDGPYILHYRDTLPPSFQKSLDRIIPLFKRMDYRGAFSNEELVVSPRKSVILDWTVRWAQPLSAIFTETWKNYTEVIFKVAQGEDVRIDTEGEYAGCLPLISEEAVHDWLDIDITKENSRNVKPVYGCNTKEGYHAVKGFLMALNLIAWGDSVKSVVNQLKDLSHEIDGHDLEIESSGLDDIVRDIHKLEENGIEF